MIEQQLKAKQGGQPAPASVVSGKALGSNRLAVNRLTFFFMSKATSANGTSMQQQAGQQVQAAAGGQPDYSKQWAEYYRTIGKIEEAEAIENQMKAAKVIPVNR